MSGRTVVEVRRLGGLVMRLLAAAPKGELPLGPEEITDRASGWNISTDGRYLRLSGITAKALEELRQESALHREEE